MPLISDKGALTPNQRLVVACVLRKARASPFAILFDFCDFLMERKITLMAIYSLNISNVSRAKGSNACATLAYITGQQIKCERLGETYSYQRKERVVLFETKLPTVAPEKLRNPERLFNEIENFEKSDNARTAKKIMIALPREFDLDKQKEVITRFIEREITARGYACTYAIHHDSDNNNPHCHILVANRQLNDTTGGWCVKRKKEYALDEKGERIPVIDKKTGEQKVDSRNRKQWKRIDVDRNPLDLTETLQSIRTAWAEECNKELDKAHQISDKSFINRGIERLPTLHEGYASRKLEALGEKSERAERNREIKSTNAELSTIISEIAQTQSLIERFKQILKKLEQQAIGALKSAIYLRQNKPLSYSKAEIDELVNFRLPTEAEVREQMRAEKAEKRKAELEHLAEIECKAAAETKVIEIKPVDDESIVEQSDSGMTDEQRALFYEAEKLMSEPVAAPISEILEEKSGISSAFEDSEKNKTKKRKHRNGGMEL